MNKPGDHKIRLETIQELYSTKIAIPGSSSFGCKMFRSFEPPCQAFSHARTPTVPVKRRYLNGPPK